MTFKSKFLSFMTSVNPNIGNVTKSDIFFVKHIQISHDFFIGDKVLKYFNDFCNWQHSISLQK